MRSQDTLRELLIIMIQAIGQALERSRVALEGRFAPSSSMPVADADRGRYSCAHALQPRRPQ